MIFILIAIRVGIGNTKLVRFFATFNRKASAITSPIIITTPNYRWPSIEAPHPTAALGHLAFLWGYPFLTWSGKIGYNSIPHIHTKAAEDGVEDWGRMHLSEGGMGTTCHVLHKLYSTHYASTVHAFHTLLSNVHINSWWHSNSGYTCVSWSAVLDVISRSGNTCWCVRLDGGTCGCIRCSDALHVSV